MSFYNNFKCRVGNSESSVGVKTGVRQWCPMSPLLFNLTIDWVMRQTTSDWPWGIRWTLVSTLVDLDFTDDLALVSHTHQHMQDKTTLLSMLAQQVGLKINQKKTEVLLLNVPNPSPVKVNIEHLLTTKESPSLVALSGGWSRHWHRGSPQQGQKSLQNAKHHVEIIPVVHQDQAKTIPELRTFHPTVRLRMMENDWKWAQQTVHLVHQEPLQWLSVTRARRPTYFSNFKIYILVDVNQIYPWQ